MIDLKSLPRLPGVYLFKDKDSEIIYVGKAKSLRERISSYFKSKDLSAKTTHLVSRICSVDFIVVDSEFEALLLENRLIKQHSPRYNISLKDSKTFAFIKITDEPYPRIISTRKVTKDGTYFGPYTSGEDRLLLMKLANSIYKIRTCKDMKKPCLKHHLGECLAHSMSQEEYSLIVERVKDFLKGKTSEAKAKLLEEMKAASREHRFEQALEKRKMLEALEGLKEKQKVDLIKGYDQDVLAFIKSHDKAFIEMFTISKGVISGRKEYHFEYSEDVFQEFIKRYYSGNKIPREIIMSHALWRGKELEAVESYLSSMRQAPVSITIPQRGEKLSLIRLAEKNFSSRSGALGVLEEIQKVLKLLSPPEIIECFDISNLQYDYVVGGMVRFVNAKPDPRSYRRFKIKGFEGANDFAGIGEIVQRRYSRLMNEDSRMPDLIILDGGRGQLSSAFSSLKGLGVSIPLVALAKQEEALYLPGREAPLRLDKNSRMMLLLRRIRDEAHRYSVGYNRKRRKMKLKDSLGRIHQP